MIGRRHQAYQPMLAADEDLVDEIDQCASAGDGAGGMPPAGLTAARALASIHGMRGDSLDQAGDKVAAIGAFEQGLAIVERLAAKDRGNKTLEPDIQEYRRILARLRGR